MDEQSNQPANEQDGKDRNRAHFQRATFLIQCGDNAIGFVLGSLDSFQLLSDFVRLTFVAQLHAKA